MTNEQQSGDRSTTIKADVKGSAIVPGDGNVVTITNTEITQISADKIKTDQFISASPYKGLKPFEPKDSDRFFGRDQFLRELISKLEQTNFILLLGASGSGKSSVVRAGLIPLLQKNRVDVFDSLIFTPNKDPFESLYRKLPDSCDQHKIQIARVCSDDTLSQVVTQLKPPNSFWLIFIDQFEELFTVSEVEKRDHFINSLVQLSKERADDPLVRIVATMRADFLDQLDPFPANQLANLTHRPMITQMQPDELRLAIEQPAAQHGVVFEQGLVEDIIQEVHGRAGYLPLLQYTLDLLWEQEAQRNKFEDRTLRTQTYRELGGVRGALQQHIDQIYELFTKTEQVAAQRIFLKLVEIGGDESAGTPVRRRAARSEFSGEAEEEVLRQLIKGNLLVSDAPVTGSEQHPLTSPDATVEIAHEILLISWEKLNTWIKENRRDIALRNRLYDDVRLWIKGVKHDNDLWDGAKLERVNELRADPNFIKVAGSFSQDAEDFVKASNGLGKRRVQERIAAGDNRRSALMELLESCTVRLSIPSQDGVSTGFFVAPGKILTCAPSIVGAGEQPIRVGWQDQENFSKATIDRVFQSNHLAILKLSSPASHPCVYLDKTLQIFQTIDRVFQSNHLAILKLSFPSHLRVYLDKAFQIFQTNDPLCAYGHSQKLAKDGYAVGNCQKHTGQRIEFKTHQNSLELQSSALLNWKTLKVCGIVQSTHDHVESKLDQYDDVITGKATPAATILASVDDLKKEQSAFHKKDRRWSNLFLPRCKPRTVALTSLGITGLIVLARFSGLLQSSELGFYDHLIRFRAKAKPSDKVLVIKATDEDIKNQQAAGESVIGSFSNKTLAAVLEKVNNELQPAAVGLDIYRDNDPLNKPEDRELKQYIAEKGSKLFTVCKAPYMDTEVTPPSYVHSEQAGFSDFLEDEDSAIRRYILAGSQNEQSSSDSECTTNSSLGLLLANQYLKNQPDGIELEKLSSNSNETPLTSSEYCLKFTNHQGYEVTFNFQRFMGGYQNTQNSTRCQMLINYQRVVEYSREQHTTNAEAVTVEDFLNGDFPTESYQNRVILIGSSSYNTLKDYWNTPYTFSGGGQMPGVVIHAQVISQIINAVLPNSDSRPMIWVLPQWGGIQWGDFLWIWGWSLTGGFLVWWWRSSKGSVMAIVMTCTSSSILCFLIFQLSSGWLPLIPIVLSVPLTGAIVYSLNQRSASRNIVESSKHHSQS